MAEFKTEQEAIEYLKKWNLMEDKMTDCLHRDGWTYQRIAQEYSEN